VAYAVPCRDVTPLEFAFEHPDLKIIEARVRVSMLLAEGNAADLDELRIEIASPARRLPLFSYSPATTLDTDIVGTVETIASGDTTRSATAGIGGNASAHEGPLHLQLSPSASLGKTEHQGVKETYRKRPPQQPIVTTGTSHAEHGVFFKFRRSTQDTLEGIKELTCRYIVPLEWKGDWLLLTCQVRAASTRYLVTTIEPCGQLKVFLGLYLQEERAGREAAGRLADAQTRYLAQLGARGDDAWRSMGEMARALATPVSRAAGGRSARSVLRSDEKPLAWFLPSTFRRPAGSGIDWGVRLGESLEEMASLSRQD
jgi:hypothetical protein